MNGDEVTAFDAVAEKRNPEWITIRIAAGEAGLRAGVTRHLKWECISQDRSHLVFKHSNGVHWIRREISKVLREHLERIVQSGPFLCPQLHELNSACFSDRFRKVLQTAKVDSRCSLTAMTWAFYNAHPELRGQEDALAQMSAFISKWLPVAMVDGMMRQRLRHPSEAAPLPVWPKPNGGTEEVPIRPS